MTLGIGGLLTEIISDVSLRILPVDAKIVNQMIDETRLAHLLAGVRGFKAADRAAFVQTVLRITDAVKDWPEGSELDLNPVTVLPDGVWLLDAAYSSTQITSNRGNS